MDTDILVIKIDKELKKKFQIKTIKEETSMTNVLTVLIQKYLEE